MRDAHRHDVHQVLAYAALYDSPKLTAALVYPMHARTWARLAARDRVTSTATISAGGRQVDLALIGVPMQLSHGQSDTDVARTWSAISTEAA